MPGNITVFNSYNEPVTQLSVGGYAAGDIAGWSQTAPRYTPSQLVVARSKDRGTKASFAIGANQVSIPWNSFTGLCTVKIPDPETSPVSLDDDLILYLTVNKAFLLTTRGFVWDVFDVIFEQFLGNAG